MNGLLQDIHYALRQLRKSPGFTTVAVLTLALGIGANTGIFTLINAVMLKSLPLPNPEQLYLITQGNFEPANTRFSYPSFQKMRAVMPPGSNLAAASWTARFYASFGGDPEMVAGQLVSGDYFASLGTYSEKGRLLDENDDREVVGSSVAVISYACWERRFGRDPDIIDRKITVNGMPLQIVGVAARTFFGMQIGAAPEFWLPTAMQSAVRYQQHYSQDTNAKTNEPWVLQPDIRWLQFIIRVSDSKLVGRASAALNQVFHSELAQAAGHQQDPSERDSMLRAHLTLVPGERGLPTMRLGSFSQPLLALMAMVEIVLLIVCANLANLLLARAAAREREIAVRLSMGASRFRLVRQLLVECVLLSFLGAGLGSVIACWLCRVLPKWASSGRTPIPLSLIPDARVLSFTMLLAVLTGIIFGLAPALHGSHVEPIRALKSSGRAAAGSAQRWSLKQALVAMQIALSLVLLVSAGLFVRTLRNFSTFDPGFDRDHLVTIDLDSHFAGYTRPQLTTLYQKLIERVEAIPGVRSASLLSCDIASGCGDASDIFLPGVPHTNGETDAQERFVSQEFFATTGIPLIQGRMFADSDTANTPKVVVVNQTFVRQFLGGTDPIGQFYGYDAANPRAFQIVGVIKDSRVNDVREDVPPMIFHSLSQDAIDVGSLNVRTFGDPALLITQIRKAVRSIDPNLPMGESSTVAQLISEGLWAYRLIARLASIFGGLALALACLGLYGVMSYTVARRTAELGIRIALGASRRAVLSLILNNVLLVIGIGVLAGLAISVASVRAIGSLLFGLSPYDPVTMLGAAAVLITVSVLAGMKPAWRAAHVNPTEALRME
jgi:predicted permease